MKPLFLLPILTCILSAAAQEAATSDPLASWNDGATKQAIVDFVERVTTKDSPDFVAPADRIAVFDNDGTLWSEQPMYVQLAFALDRIKAMAPDHPEWKTEQPFQAVLEGNFKAMAASGNEGLLKIIGATHAGMTNDQFAEIARDWFATAKHPKYDRPYTECVYQPMLELLAYLRANGFKTYIVSGGGIDLMRVFSEQVYGIPPEQVVGSSIELEYVEQDGVPTLIRKPQVAFIDDKAGKPVGIDRYIGRRPIAAFGNSDGDYEMLRYTTAGDGLRLGAIVHHTDDEREVAYDRDSHIGRLNKALDEAPERGFLLIDMKQDWRQVFPKK
ncbi:HAD family hydrolase [Aeoliella mucimassa]|uniref:Haloacid dehalogenase-like hydrolase n=1 Tax=Aeoliella mucimassa TaxID=2527972 RepID=A0A518AMY9_9BACT|nr:HAD family hydrolase [Aeoliella mucimassa]QDU56099.1 haloacid dehalogenase-like hydrolase [Aeoliella mucimassa]